MKIDCRIPPYVAFAQILYIIIMILAFGLTLGGTLTPGWRDIQGLDQNYTQYFPNGLLPSSCLQNSTASSETCKTFLESQPVWNECVFCGLLIAILLQFLGILWSCIGFCACCCRECFLYVLPGLSTAASAFLMAALIIFGINNSHAVDDFAKIYHIKIAPNSTTNEISYSYYITVGALTCSFISIGVGIFASLWPRKKAQNHDDLQQLTYYPLGKY